MDRDWWDEHWFGVVIVVLIAASVAAQLIWGDALITVSITSRSSG